MKKGGNLSDRAYELIKENITCGKLRPGDVLGESRLSEELAISRTPVRAALQRLVYEGLAETDTNKSVRVSNVTDWDISQITPVRLALETVTVQLLRDTATPEGIARLRALCDREKELTAREPIDQLALVELDYELHTTMAELTGNQFLIDTMKRIRTSAMRFLILSGTMDKYGVTGTQEHDEIVTYLERGQFDHAELSVRSHVLKIGNRILV